MQKRERRRRAARHGDVDRDHVGHSSGAGVAFAEDAAAAAAVADGHHQPGLGNRVVAAAQRLGHVARHGPRDEQQVGVPWTGDEADAEALEVVVGIVQRMDLELAAVAGAGVDVADAERAPEQAQHRVAQAPRHLLQRGVGPRRGLAGQADAQDLSQELVHRLQVRSRVGQVERLVDEREVRNDVAEHRVLERRPVLPGGIVRMAAPYAAGRTGLERDEDLAAPALDPADAARALGGRGQRRLRRPGAQVIEQRSLKAQRFERFVEAHVDARGDVAVARAGDARRERRVGDHAGMRPRVERDAAGARGEADHAEARRGLRRQPPAGDEAVLQSRVIVVDCAQHAELALEPVGLAPQAVDARCVQVNRDAARHDAVHRVAVTEQRCVAAQQILLEAQELRQAEGQAAVVAEIAEVTEVVGKALALEQQGTQLEGARRRRRAGERFERHRVGPGVGHGAVARDAAGEPRPLEQRQRLEALLDALVLVAEPGLESQHALADDREAEVTGLDGAGMHRPDRDLVHPVAFDRDEGIGCGGFERRRVGRVVAAQREALRGPGAVPQPAARIGHRAGGVARDDAEQVESCALHARRAVEDVGQVGIGVGGGVVLEPEQAFAANQQHVYRAPAVVRVTRPQRAQPPALRGGALAFGAPGLCVDVCLPGGHRTRHRSRLSHGSAHRINPPASPPAGTSRRGRAACTGRERTRSRDGRRPESVPGNAAAAWPWCRQTPSAGPCRKSRRRQCRAKPAESASPRAARRSRW